MSLVIEGGAELPQESWADPAPPVTLRSPAACYNRCCFPQRRCLTYAHTPLHLDCNASLFFSTTMSNTPLSDLMAAFIADQVDARYREFLSTFCDAMVGVAAVGNPEEKAGEVTVTDANPIGLASSVLPDGRSVILVGADPVVYRERFGPVFNAEMQGQDVLATALANPACGGIQVNSARSENSLVIERAVIVKLLHSPAPPAKPWWKFWA